MTAEPRTAVEIAHEIARQSALLRAAVSREGGSGTADIVGHLADAQLGQADALNEMAEMAGGKSGDDWTTVIYEAGRAAGVLSTTSMRLRAAQAAAVAAEAAIAAENTASRTLLPNILEQTRPSNVLKALGLVSAARPA